VVFAVDSRLASEGVLLFRKHAREYGQVEKRKSVEIELGCCFVLFWGNGRA
jgi:hypothetical protein